MLLSRNNCTAFNHPSSPLYPPSTPDSIHQTSAHSPIIFDEDLPLADWPYLQDDLMPGAFNHTKQQQPAQSRLPQSFASHTRNLQLQSADGSSFGQLSVANSPATSSNVAGAAQFHRRIPSTASNRSANSASPSQRGHKTNVLRSNERARAASRLCQDVALIDSPRGCTTNAHLPTRGSTPTQDKFLIPNPAIPQKHFQDSTLGGSLSIDTTNWDGLAGEEPPCMSHSARQSEASFGYGPSTPRTNGGDCDEGARAFQAGEAGAVRLETAFYDYLHFDDAADPNSTHNLPKLHRTVSDAVADQIYVPSGLISASMNPNFLSPNQFHNNQLSERLQAAELARSHSPHGSSRGPPSPYNELPFQASPNASSESQTISPQEALLDYKPAENEGSLFPDGDGFVGYTLPASSQSHAGHFSRPTTMNFATNAHSTGAGAWHSQHDVSSGFGSGGLHDYSFSMAGLPDSINGLPMASGNTFPSAAMEPPRITTMAPSRPLSDAAPEFPAHLTSMESSGSSAAPQTGPAASRSSAPATPATPASAQTTASPAAASAHPRPHPRSGRAQPEESPRPSDLHADSGTYSCTFRNCSERFATPQKLQKHKRDHHRSTAHAHVTPGVGSGLTTEQLLERNSQAGPHKCERINPTTGKPCNTIFSRPYDLTRHEDTIHNARKQKSKCALCDKEKTFSRSDALTRHMRVVHPEVEFPGKHRKRGPGGVE